MITLARASLVAMFALFSCATAAADVLRIYNWNNYIAPETLERFEEACKCRVSYDTYGSNEELLAKIAAGATGYDLLVPTGNAVESLIKQHSLLPLDKRRLPNLRNINVAYLDRFFDPGNVYSVPYAYTITLIGYNEQKLRQLGIPTNTWAAIFDPLYLQKLKGRVTVLDDPRELMAAALMYLGYSVNDANEAHWRQAARTIMRAKKYWAAFNNTSYIRLIAAGDIWLAQGYSNDFFQAGLEARKAGKNFTIGFSIPEQGAVLSLDSMVIPRNAPRPDLAYRFINFMLAGNNAAELTNLIGSGNPNVAALPYIEPAIAATAAIFPNRQALARLEQLRDLSRRQRQLLNRLWTEIKLY